MTLTSSSTRYKNRSAGIVLRGSQILLMHRRKNGQEYWVIPGGGIEEGETPEETVIREIKEETTLIVKPEQLVYTLQVEGEDGQKFKHFYFLCRYVSGEPVLGESPEKLRMTQEDNWYHPEWVDVTKIPTLVLHPPEIKKFLERDLEKELPCLTLVTAKRNS